MGNNSKKDLLPIYLLIGNDKLKVKTVLNKLESRMQEFGDMSFNSNKFNGQNTEAEQIIQACLQVPFASQKKYVIVTDADKISADGKNKINEYLQNPNESTVLALAFDKLAKSTRIYKTCQNINKLCIIECSAPKKYEVENSLGAIARKYNGQIDTQAAKKLVELVGQDTTMLDSEIQKLILSTKDKNITLELVKSQVERSNVAKPWDFTNAFGAKNMDECIRVYRQMPKNSEFQLIYQICKLVKELICVKDLGANANQFTLSKELKCESWKVKNHIIWAQKFSKEELNDILNKTLECDKTLKSTSVDNKYFEIFIANALKSNN